MKHVRTLSSLCAAIAITVCPALAEDPVPLEPGKEVPKLTSVDTADKAFDVTKYLKQGTTLVFFFPKANTGGWTLQACGLQEKFEEFTKRGVKILGVSMDEVDAQKEFKEKNGFEFPLLADSKGEVVDAFGVKKRGSFCARQSFLVKDGKVIWNDLKASTKEHADDVLQALDKLGSAAAKKS